MNIEDIKKLAGIVHKNGLTVLEISEGDYRIRMEAATSGPCVAPVYMGAPPVYAPPVQAESEVSEANQDDFNTIKSPMVGVFYAAPSPDAEPFIKPGDTVKAGDILCIIEAMKLMNEITAKTDGEIAEICVSNGDVVEYGQTLFKVR